MFERRGARSRQGGPLPRKWFLLAGAILSEVTGSVSLKAAAEHPGWYALTAIGFVVAFAFLGGVLRNGMALGVAYGIWGATGVALTALISAAVFGEPLTGTMALGMVLVVGGVLAVELGSQKASARRGRTA